MDKDGLHLGLDVGSVSAKTFLIDEDMNVVEEYYTRTKGQRLETVLRVLTETLARVPADRIRSVSVAGTAAKLIAELLGAEFVNEVIAQAKSTSHFHPEVKTVIEMGGEDSKLLLIDTTPGNGDYRIQDFSMNTICAAGTGSFLDQQANRLLHHRRIQPAGPQIQESSPDRRPVQRLRQERHDPPAAGGHTRL